MKEIKLKDIVAASLCQFGAFLFLTTFIFRPEVLTSYQSGDALALGPLPSALVTIVAMAVFGVICVAAAVREADHFERALSAFGFAVPCLSLAPLLVRAPLVPPLVSALCGSACVAVSYTHLDVYKRQDDMYRMVLEPTVNSLSERELEFLTAMAEGEGPHRVSDIAGLMGISENNATKIRARLIEQEIIGARRRGFVDFDMPMIRDYLTKGQYI